VLGVGCGHGFELRENQVVYLIRIGFYEAFETLDLTEEVLELGHSLGEKGILFVVGGEKTSMEDILR